MRLVELTDLVTTYLRGTIPCPHASGNWIYSDYPRYDCTFPRISLTQITGSLTPIAIGEYTEGITYGKLASIDYDIDVWVGVEDRTTIESNLYIGTKLRDKYAELIIAALEKKKEDFAKSNGIIDIEIVGLSTVPLDEEHMLHRKTITVRFSFIWER